MTDSTDPAVAPADAEPGERHASWLELFFDLTAVAGVAQLAHLLHGGPSWPDLGLYVVMFVAFWTGWMLFTVYGNVSGDEARVWTLLAGMFGLAVMAAAVHGVREGTQAGAFALAYVLVRSVAGKAWGRRREYVADLPITQMGFGLTPWIVSMWFDGAARYALWALGLAVDLAVMFSVSSKRLTARVDEEYAQTAARGRGAGRAVRLRAAYTDPAHLGERLGLFVLIVLGEGIAQVVSAASDIPWDRALYGAGAGSFVLLILLWELSLRHGSGGVPLLRENTLPTRLSLPLHSFVAGSVAAMAAALGDCVAHADEAVPERVRWLLCAGLAVFLLVAGVALVCSGRGAGRALLWAGPPVALVVAVGGLAREVRPGPLVWLLVLAAWWPVLLRLRFDRPAAPAAPDHMSS
ncbi:low temperature requirement protein A [Streptomyces sp. NPDC088097]|uniref:low temperature requirement protein A n=1 Tax=Streptomyces sp. NPDC088097 TaxID=3365823 RepID=UPI0037F6F9D8